MVATDTEDAEEEALVLAAAVFSGRDADAVVGRLVEDKAERCRGMLAGLSRGTSADRRRRLERALRRSFALPAPEFLCAPPPHIAALLLPEPAPIRSLALGDLPASLAADVSARILHAPSRPAEPFPPVRTWLRRWLAGGVGE